MTIAASTSDVSLNHEFPDLSDEFVSELVNSIDRVGYGVVSDYLEPRELDQLRTLVEDSVRAAGNRYVCFTGCADLAGTPLERMAKSPVFRRLCTRIYERATGKQAPDQPYHQILRCLTGSSGQQHSPPLSRRFLCANRLAPDLCSGRTALWRTRHCSKHSIR
jgi:hypothetical protein